MRGLLGLREEVALKSEHDEQGVSKSLPSLRHWTAGRRRIGGLEEQVVLMVLDQVVLDGVCEMS